MKTTNNENKPTPATPLYLNGKPIKGADIAKALLTAILEEGSHLASIEQTPNNGVHIVLYTRYNNIK